MGTKEKEESTTKAIENESHGILFLIKNFTYKFHITLFIELEVNTTLLI